MTRGYLVPDYSVGEVLTYVNTCKECNELGKVIYKCNGNDPGKISYFRIRHCKICI